MTRYLMPIVLVLLVVCSNGEGNPSSSATPTAANVEVGRPYAHKLFVHCGTLGTEFAGRAWDADPPISEHNPPEGWDENEEQGTMKLLSRERAEFRSNRDGKTVEFKPRSPGSPDPNENCE